MKHNQVGVQTVGLILGAIMLLAACGKSQPKPISPPRDTPVPPGAMLILPTESTIPIVATSTENIGQNPSPRGYTSMAYDTESDRVILYGGQTGNYIDINNISNETWAYEPSTNKWTQMKPSSDPGKRAAAELAYDSESDRVILFGGCYNCDTAVLNDTWAYDFNTNTWTEMKAEGPANTIGARLAYDAESDRIILFYGSNETWAYDFNTDTWTDMKPSISSSAFRNYHAMTYDSKADRVLVWGGSADGSLSIWSYDFNTNNWEEIKPLIGTAPPYRDYPIFVYDEKSDQTILFGGYPSPDHITWAYDYNTNIWTKMQSSITPGELSRNDMVYNNAADRIILFGGQVGSTQFNYSAETWTYDFNSDTWTNLTPLSSLFPTAIPTTIPTELPIGASPSARAFAAMTYDTESDRVILYGGATGDFREPAFINGETWAYEATNNQWIHMEPSLSPQKRLSADMAYDSESDRVILFGGLRVLTSAENDTWAYDFNTDTWTEMNAKGPANHEGACLAYDAESDRVILFGGYGSTYYNDTWAYDFNMDTWTEMKPKTSPPGRNYQAMTYDSKADRILTWGGLDDAGNPIDESVWAYDFNTNTWTEIKPTQGTWPRGRDFAVMAYDIESDRTILYGGDPIGHETWAFDFNTNTWTKLKPDTSPGRMSRHVMVYNTAIDRVVLFGGQSGTISFTYTEKIWFYDYNTNTWTNMTLQK